MSTILITGANRGIGLELARCFAQDNWNVLACCRDPKSADALQALASEFQAVSIYALDVSDPQQISELGSVLEGKPIDILFNNAGVFGPSNQSLGDSDADGWLKAFRVNTIAPFQMAEAFVEQVTGSERRIMATMGSIMGSIAENTSGNHYAYRSSKAAVHMVMKGLAMDLKDRGVTSVVFHPGWVHTEMGGPEAPLSPAESAAGLKKVLLSLSIKDSGGFFDYLGEKRPW